MRILIINQKGGVGKTSICVLLAATCQQAGVPVTITDLDPHETASAISDLRFKISSKAHQGAHEIVDSPSQFDLATPLGHRVLECISASDRIVVVSEKSYLAYRPTLSTARIVAEHRSLHSKAYILFNKVRSDCINKEFDGSGVIKEFGHPILKTSLPFSSNFERYLSEGMTAMALRQQKQMIKLALEIFA